MHTHLILKESIGWLATAAFAASYVFKTPTALRRTQAVAATIWISYGVLAGALPVIVANSVVAFMAVVYPWMRVRVSDTTGKIIATPADFAAVPDAMSPMREKLDGVFGPMDFDQPQGGTLRQ